MVHRLRVEADGHIAREQEIKADASKAERVELKQKKAAARAARGRKRPRRAVRTRGRDEGFSDLAPSRSKPKSRPKPNKKNGEDAFDSL